VISIAKPGALKKPSASEDPVEHRDVLNKILKEMAIKNPVKIAMAGRMVTVWQRINYIDECIKEQGLHFRKFNEDGELIGVNVNQLAFYQKQLEAEFRSYYRILNQKWNQKKEESADSFLSLLENAKKVKKPKKKKSKVSSK